MVEYGGFIALGALMVTLFAWMRLDMKALREEMREDMRRLESRLAAVEHGQARLEGLLEGLREAIAGRAAAK